MNRRKIILENIFYFVHVLKYIFREKKFGKEELELLPMVNLSYIIGKITTNMNIGIKINKK